MSEMTDLEKEPVPACWVCGKVWRRCDSDKWYYFGGILVCKHHEGADTWYAGALTLADEALRGNENNEEDG
jgi:hypothetical protein